MYEHLLVFCYNKKMKSKAKPFVKWAGGKTQLLGDIDSKISSSTHTYIEPFVGGGAVLFHLLNHYPNLQKVIVNDINTDLIDTYKTVKENLSSLIELLGQWQEEYYCLLAEEDKKKAYYYGKRDLFNQRVSDRVLQSALFIFLNKTCFNGLYRVNRKGEFNVPIGSYKKPLICDVVNLEAVHYALQKVEILNGDFEQTLTYAEDETLFYFDPPYKPLSKTSSFNSYAKEVFDDTEQIRLANFCKEIDKLGYHWILSNSDIKGENPNDNFFDNLFEDFSISRVLAKRSINANADRRGFLTELLITNTVL